MMFTYDVYDTPKMLRETLCVAQTHIALSSMGQDQKQIHIDRIQRLIDECDRKRPLDPEGKHGNQHTAECGCKYSERMGG